MDLGDEMRMGWKYGLLPRQTTQNLQTFEGNLGGVQASAPDFNTAAGRSCDNQKNKCSQAANNGPQKFEVTKCDEQAEQCKNTIDTITKQSFSDPVFSGTVGDFDIFCDP
ncbi:hypothetical protein CFIO01_06532 [Colletotrichum fioriniae PJ7]|uniref:Uncharacterized protein n=1 Tax=Colletotrichum fioriniae PJ7 TaxID=1445577 RepID=A0A010SJJ1_9PEZI|nr:hypothetical protein CFIO01_06532 [Colletotrichum fioriniae PJ7]